MTDTNGSELTMSDDKTNEQPATHAMTGAKIDFDAFLRDLTDLTHLHGLALADEPHVYIMERDDFRNEYISDDDSRLLFQ